MVQSVIYAIVLTGFLQTTPLSVNECDRFSGFSRYNTYLAYLSDGRKNLGNENYAEAIEDFDCADTFAPTSAEIYHLRGTAYYHKGLYEQALEDANRAIDLRLRPLELGFLNRGIIYFQLSKKAGLEDQSAENFDKALQDFAFALELDPKNHNIYQWRATAYIQLKQFDKAIVDWTKALELEPENTLIYYQRGWVHAVSNQYQAALNDFETAIHLGMNTAEVYRSVGQMYSRLGDNIRSIRYYDLAIRRDHDFIFAYAERGHSYFVLGNYLRAIENYDRTIELGANSGGVPASIYVFRGRSYVALNEFNEAETDFLQAIEVDPLYADTYLLLGQLYDIEQLYDEAVDQYLMYLELAGEDVMPWVRERVNLIRGFHPL
jgi:tetratricopeptide (TPR) repeat protein